MDQLPPFFIPPTAHPHTHTAVFLHGRGGNVWALVRALRLWTNSDGHNLARAFPTFRWVFPQAPMRTLAAATAAAAATTSPITATVSWPQWFDVWNGADFGDREGLQAEGLREQVPRLRGVLAAEAARLGGRWDRVVLAGISMGGAAAAHVLFNLDVPPSGGGRLAALVGLACRCPFAARSSSLADMRAALALEDGVPGGDAVVRGTPVLLEHCLDDELITIEHGRRMCEILTQFGAVVESREYPHGGHWFNAPQGANDAIAFLRKHVYNPDCNVVADDG
ncbi:carboxylesterase [Gaeumannomyces tritici R3-111a-1]|uniref:Carboxylesterase n=1 Tax=Gaeumannomyces tritici (strain R3-111a-1) TaxID=644352 RepID=J3NRD5_GAET3|nr:carboxylesterase [Gaeumannomyces tritici R3-111a-1]EJT78741.1 carboxylesterase [Gaeumannomyces tritici R3-111a-1]